MSKELTNDVQKILKEHAETITKPKKNNFKPTLQIYRPPGLRNVSAQSSVKKDLLVDIDQASNASSDSRSSNQSENAIANLKGLELFQPKKLFFEKKNLFQQKYQNKNLKLIKKSSESKAIENFNNSSTTAISNKPKEMLIRPQFMKETETTKKKTFTNKNFLEIVTTLNKLDIAKEKQLIEQFIMENMSNENLGSRLGECLVQYAIEESKQSSRIVSRLCAALLECPVGYAFQNGFLTSVLSYFECRDQLRQKNLRVWINFLNFVSELYLNVGFCNEGDLVETIFKIFEYMLKDPILDSLKIEELECLISTLLSIGYDLERDCPDQLGLLKNQIRDAFLAVNEPWARKMLLILMELGASGWTLSPDANEYYFQ